MRQFKRTEGHTRPYVMGVLNVTPDSFSDGGRYIDADAAVRYALEMIDAGAEIIDVGAESTRPGFSPVPEEEEIARLVPVIRRLSESTDVPISADTMKTGTARAALDAGADIINDINSMRWPGMMDLVAESGVPVIIMHMTGSPEDTHTKTVDGDVIGTVRDSLLSTISAAEDRGIGKDRIIADPGIGFGKTMDQNTQLIDRLDELDIGCPLLVGVSRKRVLAHMYPGMDPDEATVKASMIAAEKGADILRVHDVGRLVRALRR